MSNETVLEQTILEELQRVPRENWAEVVRFIRSLQPGKEPRGAGAPIHSGADLAGSDLIGIWANRTDVQDSREFARQLRTHE
jgi:hypothetical protein